MTSLFDLGQGAPKGVGSLRVLALDCATRTGWATNSPSHESGYQDFTIRRGSSPGMRFLDFTNWLDELVSKVNPEVLVYEQAHHRGGAATEIGVGMATRVMEAAARHGIEYRAVHTATLKLWATGKGNADKIAMVARACELSPYGIDDDNEADAYLMMRWAEAGFPETEKKPKGKR